VSQHGKNPSLEPVACPYCGSRRARPWRSSPDRLLRRFDTVWTALRCRDCGVCYTSPRPASASIGDHYPDKYAPYRPDKKSGRSSDFFALGRLKPNDHAFMVHELGYQAQRGERSISRWRARFPSLAMVSSPPPPADLGKGRLLEIGCSHGLYLERVRMLGWRVQGVELSRSASEFARGERGLDVHTGPFQADLFPEASFECVVMWQVLEHVAEPLEVLGEVFRLTRPGGVLMIGVPNSGCLLARLAGDYFYPLDLPRHLTHFTVSSIRRFVESAGFRVRRLYHQPAGRDAARSICCWVDANLPARWGERAWRLEKNRGLRRFSRCLGLLTAFLKQGARLTVIAEKKGP